VKAACPTPRSTLVTVLTSALAGTGMSMTARAQSRDKLVARRNLPIRDENNLAVKGAEPGDPERHLFHRPRGADGTHGGPDRHHVAVVVLALGNNEEASQEILYQRLRAESQPDAQRGGWGHERTQWHTQALEHQTDHNHVKEREEHSPHDASDGMACLATCERPSSSVAGIRTSMRAVTIG